ncbi:hypothetical protein Tco_1146003 [Tanacetum coccineum]
MNGNPSGSDEIPSKNLTGWLQDAVVGESIVIHTTSELQLILRHPFDILDCKVNHLGGSRILLEFRNEKEGHHSSTNCLESEMSAKVGEKLEHAFDLGSDRIDPIVEGGFSSNCGELKQQLNPNVEVVFTNDVVQQQDPGDDDKDVKPSDPEINGKGDEIIRGSPITTGLVGVLLSHNGDGDNNHGDDGFRDVEGTVTEMAPHDVDTLVTRESKAVVTVVSDSQKIRDPVFKEVSTDKQLFSNLKVFKTCDDMDSCTNKAQWNKFTPLPPNGLRSSKKAFKREDPSKVEVKHVNRLGSFDKFKCPKKKKNLLITYMEGLKT